MVNFKYLAERFPGANLGQWYWSDSVKETYTHTLFQFSQKDPQLRESDIHLLSQALLANADSMDSAQKYLEHFQNRSDFSELNQVLIRHLDKSIPLGILAGRMVAISSQARQINELFDNSFFVSAALALKSNSKEELEHLITLIRRGVNYQHMAYAAGYEVHANPEELIMFLKSEEAPHFEITEESETLEVPQQSQKSIISEEQVDLNLRFQKEILELSQKIGIEYSSAIKFKGQNYSQLDRDSLERISENPEALRALKSIVDFLKAKQLMPRFERQPPLLSILGIGRHEKFWMEMTDSRVNQFADELEKLWSSNKHLLNKLQGVEFVKAFEKTYMRLIVLTFNLHS